MNSMPRAQVSRRLRRAGALARRHPFSVGLVVMLVATGVASGTLAGARPVTLGLGEASFSHGYWWTAITALVVPGSWLELLIAAALVLTLLTYAERRLGSLRCALVFFVTGALGVALGAGILSLSDGWGSVWAVAEGDDLVFDPVIGVCGALMAASGRAPVLFRRRIRIVGFSLLAMLTLYGGDIDALFRLGSAVLGLATGVLGRREGGAWYRSSYGETRTLVAAVVAVTGLGPLVVLITGVGAGPLAPVVAAVRGTDIEAVLARCSTAPTERCVADLSTTLAGGASAFAMALLPLLLAVIAAWGLRRGRRAAWVLALVQNAGMILLIARSMGMDDLGRHAELAVLDAKFPGFAVVAFAVPLAICVLLLVTRRRFAVRVGRGAIMRMLVIVGGAFVLVVAVDVVLLLTLAGRTDLPAALSHAVRHLLPAGIGRVPGAHLPGLAHLIDAAMGAVFGGVVAVALFGLLRAPALLPDGDPERFRALLRHGGGGSMSFMGTWAGTRHWFSSDGRSAVAYRLVSGIALTVGDPVCAPADREATVRGFADYCDRRAWIPALYGIHDSLLPIVDALGWRTLPVGEETVVQLARFGLAGNVWSKVRQPYNRGARDGLVAEWTRWAELPATTVAELVALSEQWVAEKALPEMRFTLGGMDELDDPDVALLLARGPDGRVQAVTSWLPRWTDGEIIGWTLDFMRRADGAMPGVMEFLIASAALRMKEEGLEEMSLSGAPLAGPAGEAAGDAAPLLALLAWLSRTLEPAYGFASLLRFKDKFHPEHRSLFLAYADSAQLPAIGLALARAYLPDLSAWRYPVLLRALGG